MNFARPGEGFIPDNLGEGCLGKSLMLFLMALGIAVGGVGGVAGGLLLVYAGEPSWGVVAAAGLGALLAVTVVWRFILSIARRL